MNIKRMIKKAIPGVGKPQKQPPKGKVTIEKAVERAVKEYGEAIRDLKDK